MPDARATIMAGIPAHNMALYHRIRFLVGDPAVLIELPDGPSTTATLILRDIEMDRAAPGHAPTRCPARPITRPKADCPAIVKPPRRKRRRNCCDVPASAKLWPTAPCR